jgi:DNA polymerase-3 subunit gamma/tau
VPEAARAAAVTEVERTRGAQMTALPMRILSRAWQMLMKGIGEVQTSMRPVASAEMVLIRLAYAADLPTPDETLRSLQSQGGNGGGTSAPSGGGGGGGGGARASSPALAVATRAEPRPMAAPAAASAQPAMRIARFEDLVALAAEKRDIALKVALERDVRLVRFEDGRLEFAQAQGASPQLASDISKRLTEWTGRRWIVALSSEEGQPTLKEKADAEARERLTGVRADPLVRAVLERFPGAQIVDVRDVMEAAPPPASAADDDATGTEDPPIDLEGFDDEF